MRFEKAPASLITTFDRALLKAGGERRQMFGYPCGFEKGQMFCGVFASTVFVRLEEAERESFLKRGAKPFEPTPGRRMKEYVVLPAGVVDDAAALHHWLEMARGFANSLPASPPKPPRRASAPSRARKGSGAKPRPPKVKTRRR